MHVRFHAIQWSDCKIDDRFKQSLMTNQSNNLQQIVSINLRKTAVQDGLSSEGEMSKPVLNQRIWPALFGGWNQQ